MVVAAWGATPDVADASGEGPRSRGGDVEGGRVSKRIAGGLQEDGVRPRDAGGDGVSDGPSVGYGLHTWVWDGCVQRELRRQRGLSREEVANLRHGRRR